MAIQIPKETVYGVATYARIIRLEIHTVYVAFHPSAEERKEYPTRIFATETYTLVESECHLVEEENIWREAYRGLSCLPDFEGGREI
jgi:hypothetical protein